MSAPQGAGQGVGRGGQHSVSPYYGRGRFVTVDDGIVLPTDVVEHCKVRYGPDCKFRRQCDMGGVERVLLTSYLDYPIAWVGATTIDLYTCSDAEVRWLRSGAGQGVPEHEQHRRAALLTAYRAACRRVEVCAPEDRTARTRDMLAAREALIHGTESDLDRAERLSREQIERFGAYIRVPVTPKSAPPPAQVPQQPPTWPGTYGDVVEHFGPMVTGAAERADDDAIRAAIEAQLKAKLDKMMRLSAEQLYGRPTALLSADWDALIRDVYAEKNPIELKSQRFALPGITLG